MRKPTSKDTRQIVIDLLMGAIFVSVLIAGLRMRSLAGYFPSGIGGAGLALVLIKLGVDLRAYERERDKTEKVEDLNASRSSTAVTADQSKREAFGPGEGRKALRYIGWIAGYALALAVLGTLLASFLFVAVFYLVEARRGLLRAVIVGGAVSTVAWVLADIVNLRLIDGMLFS